MIRVSPPFELEKTVIEPLLKQSIFPTKYKAMAFAGALGLFHKKREPLGKRGEGISLEYFQTHGDAAVIDVIALASLTLKSTDELLLMDTARIKERVQVFEEYAHGGLKMIRQACFEESDSILDGILHLYDGLAQGTEDAQPDLDKQIFG